MLNYCKQKEAFVSLFYTSIVANLQELTAKIHAWNTSFRDGEDSSCDGEDFYCDGENSLRDGENFYRDGENICQARKNKKMRTIL